MFCNASSFWIKTYTTCEKNSYQKTMFVEPVTCAWRKVVNTRTKIIIVFLLTDRDMIIFSEISEILISIIIILSLNITLLDIILLVKFSSLIQKLNIIFFFKRKSTFFYFFFDSRIQVGLPHCLSNTEGFIVL